MNPRANLKVVGSWSRMSSTTELVKPNAIMFGTAEKNVVISMTKIRSYVAREIIGHSMTRFVEAISRRASATTCSADKHCARRHDPRAILGFNCHACQLIGFMVLVRPGNDGHVNRRLLDAGHAFALALHVDHEIDFTFSNVAQVV